MKVPTYQAQSQQTPKTGAGTFSVAASPTNISRGLAAQTDLFSQLQGTSLKFLEAETRVQRSTELSQAENAFDFQMQGVTMKALEDQNPNSMLSNWNASTTDLYNNIALNINDPVVKRQFIAKAQNSILAKRLSVLKTARTRRIDNAKAEKDIEIYRLKKTIATGNATEREAAKVALFGREAGQKEFFTGDTLPRVPSIYEKMANAGLLTQTEKVTAELDAKGDIQNMEISQDMTAARVSGNPLHAQAIIDNLQDSSNYPDLFGEERDQLIKDAIALRDAQTTDMVTQEKAQIALENAKATKKKEETFDDFMLRIDQSKLQANRAEGITPPTLEEIETQYSKGNLKYERYKVLKDKIETGDLESSNSVLVQEFNNKIDLAGSDKELDGIREQIDAASEMLDTGTMSALKTRINGRKGNTPRSIEITTAKNNLKQVLGIRGSNMDSEENAILRLAAMDALTTFDELVAKDGDPKAIANYLAQGYYSNLAFADDFPNLALAPSIMQRATEMMGQKNTLSPGEVTQLNQMITLDERLSPNMKAEERRTLKLYVEHLNRLNLLDRMSQ